MRRVSRSIPCLCLGMNETSSRCTTFQLVATQPTILPMVPTPCLGACCGQSSHFDPKQYTLTERKHFNAYHKLFKLDSKPKSHIEALSTLTDAELKKLMPASLARLADFVIAKVEALQE